VTQGLKPNIFPGAYGPAEAVPLLQSVDFDVLREFVTKFDLGKRHGSGAKALGLFRWADAALLNSLLKSGCSSVKDAKTSPSG
jgi:hypothetical protein